MTKDLNKEIEDKVEEFTENYIEYTDGGVFVRYTGLNGIDIDDWLRQTLQAKDRECEEKQIKLLEGVKEKIKEETKMKKYPHWQKSEFETGYNQALSDLQSYIDDTLESLQSQDN